MDKETSLSLLLLFCILGCQAAGMEESPQSNDDSSSGQAAGLVRLDEEAQEAIDIEAAPASVQTVPEVMKSTGWLMTIPGQEAVMKARVTGVFEVSSEQPPIVIGRKVTSGEQLGKLRTVLTPQEESQLVIAKEEADVLMNQALVSKELAESQLRGIQKMDANNAISGTRLLELQETIARNEVAYKEARDKLSFLPKEPYSDELHLRPQAITSPLSGQISTVNVVPNQLVIQGDPLWSVSDWSSLWIKVPVFAEDLPRILEDASASVFLPEAPSSLAVTPVNAVVAPATNRRSFDIFYLVDNSEGKLRPGQPLSIDLPVGKPKPQVTVARSAIVWDGMGNAWVYIQSDEETFHRRKVELGPIVGDQIAIKQGIESGEQVVVRGAQSIFGEEFKNQLQAEDDD
ncbi:efflux RND transporter periplasmic adaptor subunit [bacterium]|nr:efflux RND transporter periplasmic adaptor subunit [bacterium]